MYLIFDHSTKNAHLIRFRLQRETISLGTKRQNVALGDAESARTPTLLLLFARELLRLRHQTPAEELLFQLPPERAQAY